MRISAMRTLGRLFTFQLMIRESHSLIRAGPYAIVRHPSYTGALIMFLGGTIIGLSSEILTASIGRRVPGVIILGLALVPPLMTFWRVAFPRVRREEMLIQAFGDEWWSYTRATPWRILPGAW